VKALVLAAGRATRLGAASGGLPKPLTDVGGTTPLEQSLAWVAAQRPARIWINLHEQADRVRARIGDVVGGVSVSYSYEPKLLGTAGAWVKLEHVWTETSIVVYGDNVMSFDLGSLLAAHRSGGALVTIALFDPDRHLNTGTGGGRVLIDAARIAEFVEGGGEGMINAGVYCVEPELRERLPQGYSDFGYDVLPSLARSGELAGHVIEDDAYCLGIDTPQRLELARTLMRSRLECVQ
jgi:NDP-sugar pyrophosphorylase family protein